MAPQMLSRCDICDADTIVRIPYGNHRRKISLFLIKHLVAAALLKVYRGSFLSQLRTLTLFSPLFSLMRCQTCGYAKYQKQISPLELSDYYATAYWNERATPVEQQVAEDDHYSTRARSQVAFLETYLADTPLRVLDIGAGSSEAPRLLRFRRGADKVRLYAVEPGAEWKEFYHHKNITKVGDFFGDSSYRKYDVLFSSHWLEHVLDLEKTMSTFQRETKKGAVISIEVPYCDEDYFKSDSQDTPHIHFFTPRSLKLLFQNYGFTSISCRGYCAKGQKGSKVVRAIFKKP